MLSQLEEYAIVGERSFFFKDFPTFAATGDQPTSQQVPRPGDNN